MSIGKRIRALLQEKKKSQIELADQTGVSQAAVSKWCRGESSPDLKTLHAIADFFGVEFSFLAEGNSSRVSSSAIVKIPIYEAEASAGHGCLNDTEAVESYLMIDRETIRGELQCNPDNLAIIRVRGDSMTPTIKPGEAVVIDKTAKTIVSDGLYVIRMANDVIVVKRVQTLPKNINIISDNKAYPPYQIGFDDTEGLAVIGRVMKIISMKDVGA